MNQANGIGISQVVPFPWNRRVAAAFRSLPNLDLGGFRLQLKPGDNQASDLVELTFLGSQRWGP